MRLLEAGSGVRPLMRCRSALAAIAMAMVPALAPAQPATSADSFRAFLPTFEAATRSFLDGDNAAWKELLSAEPGGTLFTPFGGVVRGASALGEQYDRAAARFAPGPARLEVEYLSVEVSGDLACVVALQRGIYRPAGSNSTRAGFTRVTMVFRREAGRWKLRHRHMDHLGADTPQE
jgi:ketosteroid isomerase-like protein